MNAMNNDPKSGGRRLRLVAFGAGVLAGFAACLVVTLLRVERAPLLSSRGLLRVAPGMTSAEVVALLGYPVNIVASGSKLVAPIGSPGSRWPDAYVWIYARPATLIPGLEVAVVFDGDQVKAVNVQHRDSTVYATGRANSPSNLAKLADTLE